MRQTTLALVLAALVVGSWPLAAHHSHNAYEVTAWTSLEGKVTEIHYLLPHSWIYIEVKDEKGGEPTLWALEATGPQGIFKNGVSKEDVKVGDTIKVRCHLLRDGAPGCLLGFVTPMHGDRARGHGVEHQWD